MNDPLPPLPPKRDVCLALLSKAAVFIHLDPRREGVSVPPWFRKQPQLVLQVGYQMAKSIPDLNVGEDVLTCTLSFSNSPFFCSLPWSAMFALVGEDGRGMVWPDDVPREVAAQVQQRREGGEAPEDEEKLAPEPAKGKKPRAVKAVKRRPTVVPVPAVSPIAKAGNPAKPERRGPTAVPAPSGARANPPSAVPTEKKPKRELPPYLRVIK